MCVDKVESALQTAEDVAEAVEKVAEGVEKVAEDIAENLPKGGKLREAVDFVEKIAERTAKDAGVVDDFIDKVLYIFYLFIIINVPIYIIYFHVSCYYSI